MVTIRWRELLSRHLDEERGGYDVGKNSMMGTRDPFTHHLAKALKEYADAVADDLIKESQALLEKNIRMQVASMAVRLAKEAMIERNGEELLIRVKFDA